MAVADRDVSLVLTGNGDVLEPEDGLVAIGSGGPYALSAARALVDIDGMDAGAIAEKAMRIAAEICVFTNANLLIETLEFGDDRADRRERSSRSSTASSSASRPPSAPSPSPCATAGAACRSTRRCARRWCRRTS